jgi:hypothetical protein
MNKIYLSYNIRQYLISAINCFQIQTVLIIQNDFNLISQYIDMALIKLIYTPIAFKFSIVILYFLHTYIKNILSL